MVSETSPERDAGLSAYARLRARLADARWILLAAAILAALAVLVDAASSLSAAAGLALVVAAALLPRRGEGRRAAVHATSSAGAAPETMSASLIEAIAHPAVVIDERAIVRLSNAAVREAFPATETGYPITFSLRQPAFASAIEDAASAMMPESLELRERDGAERLYRVNARPIRGRGAASLMLVVFEDMSEQLATARMRSDFVANASHELRTPLASLVGFIETLQGAARNDAAARDKFLAIMLEEAGRMSRLISDLLSLSRAEMNVHRRPRDRVDLAALVRHVVDAMLPLADKQGTEIVADLPEGPVELRGDGDALVQVTQNLLENALKYGRNGGRVELRLTASERRVALSVRDFGPGIAPEHVPRLTERFYRVDVEESRARQGTGLGLAIVKHILARHRGELLVESRPGEGAVFTVSLPLI